MPEPRLQFGIPSLDELFGQGEEHGLEIPGSEATSFCLIGPDGTGKSVFALHLVNQYLASFKDFAGTKILYVSTDLRFDMAQKMANNFGLKPFHPLKTADYGQIADFFLNDKHQGTDGADHQRVGFVDLASDSAGDDWALIARLISLMEEPSGDTCRHLLVVDAVEGLETLAGETDAYGQKVSRRARIALLMRLASHKCHLGLIVEEPLEYTRLPEEFVVDTVIRLRSTLINGYTRRTVEIEKARGQALGARGQHPFQIHHPQGAAPQTGIVRIYPSLHFQGARLRTAHPSLPSDSGDLVSFGIRHLDTMLQKNESMSNFGLSAGRPHAIIGEAGTLKTSVADAFLAQAVLDQLDANLGENSKGVIVLCTSRPRPMETFARSLARQLLSHREEFQAIDPTEEDRLSRQIQALSKEPNPRILIEEMAIRDQPGPYMAFRIETLITKAIENLKQIGYTNNNHRIRLVFDDLSSFRNTYPDLGADPLLLPLTIEMTRRYGISTIIVSTHAGKPDIAPTREFDAALRSLVDGQILTWRVPFFGEMRIAITFVPGQHSESGPAIRELKCIKTNSGDSAIDIDPDFELFDGLDIGKPFPVPLEIRLYAETPAFVNYFEHEGKLMQHLFPGRLPGEKTSVITAVGRNEYDSLRDYCYLSASTRLARTLVMQVDEFWQPAKNGMFSDLKSYFDTPLTTKEADHYEDPYGLFWRNDFPSNETLTRSHLFSVGVTGSGGIRDRIPFMWDFGFLLLSHTDWYSAMLDELPLFTRSLNKPIKVADVFWNLQKPSGCLDERSSAERQSHLGTASSNGFRGPSSWRALLEASTVVARKRRARDSSPVKSFDLARPAGESFCSLILEIWISEIVEQYRAKLQHQAPLDESKADLFFRWVQKGEQTLSLSDLLEDYSLELYMAWMLLIESIDMTSFVDPNSRFAFATEPNPTQAASMRHWYKTACDAPSVNYSESPDVPVRLPGFFSVRGDWNLALASGSRSLRLGTKALDFLSSRRANISRLQQGLGLPTRDIGHPDGLNMFRTRLSYLNGRKRRATVDYSGILEIGADETLRSFRNACSPNASRDHIFAVNPKEEPRQWREMADGTFYWLRRSHIKYYARNAKIWQKWLLRVMLALQGTVNDQGAVWQSGFEVYDEIAKATSNCSFGREKETLALPTRIADLPSLQNFNKLVDFVKLELNWHTRQDTRPEKQAAATGAGI